MFAEHLVLDSLWLCVAFVVALAVLRLARRDPVVGYRVLLILLGAGLVLPAMTLPLAGRAATTGDRVLARFVTEPEPAATVATAAAHEPALDAARSLATADASPSVATADAPPRFAPHAIERDAGTPRDGTGAAVTLAAKNEALRIATTKQIVAPTLTLRTRVREAAVAVSSWLRGVTPYVVFCWMLGAVLVGRRLLLRVLGTARIVRDARPVDDAATLACWRAASADRPNPRPVLLRRSDAVDAPACWGVMQPVILLPAVDRTPPDALTFALRHELMHLERRDPLAALAQAALKTVYWFHPVAWWLSAHIDRVREFACDQLVVSNATQRKRYALALIDHAQAALAVPALAQPAHSRTLLHWAPTLSQLRRRIDMLLTKSTPLPLRRRLIVLGGAASAVLVLLAAQGTVAATMLSDAPLSERLVACCPPKTTTPAPASPLFQIDPVDAKRHAKPHHAKPRVRSERSTNSGITQAPGHPFTTFAPPLFSANLALPNTRVTAGTPAQIPMMVGSSDQDTLRDALVNVLTGSNDAAARVTAAKALGTRLSDPQVRRAFARVLRDEWEGSEVREAVGEALLTSEQFTSEAHEIIAALLKREVSDDSSEEYSVVRTRREDRDDDEVDAGGDDDADEFEIDIAGLNADLEGLDVELQGLDTETLEDLSDLRIELGTLQGLSIDLGDAIKSLKCDAECDLDCDDECDESCDDDSDDSCDDECDDDCDDEASEDDKDDADDRKSSIVDLLQSVRDHRSNESTNSVLRLLQQKQSEGAETIALSDLLRALLRPETPAPAADAPKLLDGLGYVGHNG